MTLNDQPLTGAPFQEEQMTVLKQVYAPRQQGFLRIQTQGHEPQDYWDYGCHNMLICPPALFLLIFVTPYFLGLLSVMSQVELMPSVTAVTDHGPGWELNTANDRQLDFC